MKQMTQKYYIAYFDVLGYKAFFENEENDIYEFLKANIELAKETISKASDDADYLNMNIEVKSFSDNFIFLIPVSSNSDGYQEVKALVFLMAKYQLNFLKKHSIVIRGTITKGEAYIDENIVFGEGLIRAVELEGQANFPRIILDSENIGKDICDELCEKFVLKDEDEVYYVDFFSIIGWDAYRDDDFFFDEKEYVKEMRKNVVKLINKYGKYNRNLRDPKKIQQAEKTISKYAWLLTKYNQYCEQRYPELMISYILTLYYRIMKCEIEVKS